jgi:hypothetical protein
MMVIRRISGVFGRFPLIAVALLVLTAGGCASFAIEIPRHVMLTAGERAEIVGGLVNGRTPVGGVDLADGRLPPGLELEFVREAMSFAIRGVPSEPGRYEVGIHAWTYGTNYPGDHATATVSIEVVD